MHLKDELRARLADADGAEDLRRTGEVGLLLSGQFEPGVIPPGGQAGLDRAPLFDELHWRSA